MSQSKEANQPMSEYLSGLKRAEEFMAVGFPKQEDWQNSPAVYAEGKLSICGHSVMEDWEAPYMEELAKLATSNGGVVLEVGFGLGLSASYIQSKPIDKHIIIEANADVFKKLQEFAQTAEKKVEPLFGFWQDAISSIPDESVDGIFFDTYPLSEADVHPTSAIPFFKEAYRILKKGGVFTYFSCEVDDFSPYHLEMLQAAGFEDIHKKVFPMNTPETCWYWSSDTMVVPIIRK